LRLEYVGAQIGSELREKGEWAMLVAMLSILIYIGFRFEFLYGIGAIFALLHDVILTLGFFSITQLQFDLSVLSAILAVIGYSLNDTIVVYDRIRENIRMVRKKNFLDILNISINQTLSRTIITSLTTLFVLLSLLLAGGIAVKFFAIAMIVGVLIGTYSSIFIASTSLYFLGANPES
jgi:preprotein translocase subunit SecF